MTHDPDSWADWLAKHGPALVLLARQWTPHRADAEDIVQEGFLRFWRSRHTAADRAAYLYVCVKHYAAEWLRSRRRRTRREESTARPESDRWLVCPLELDERRTAVEAALRLLPEDQREVVVLKIWSELSFAQIAAVLEISANTAASRYRYALEKLREQLAEEPIR